MNHCARTHRCLHRRRGGFGGVDVSGVGAGAGVASAGEGGVAVGECGQRIGAALCMRAGVGVVDAGGELGEALVDQRAGGGGHGAGQSGLAGSPPVGADLDVAVGVDAGTTSFDGFGIDLGDNRIDERSKSCR